MSFSPRGSLAREPRKSAPPESLWDLSLVTLLCLELLAPLLSVVFSPLVGLVWGRGRGSSPCRCGVWRVGISSSTMAQRAEEARKQRLFVPTGDKCILPELSASSAAWARPPLLSCVHLQWKELQSAWNGMEKERSRMLKMTITGKHDVWKAAVVCAIHGSDYWTSASTAHRCARGNRTSLEFFIGQEIVLRSTKSRLAKTIRTREILLRNMGRSP